MTPCEYLKSARNMFAKAMANDDVQAARALIRLGIADAEKAYTASGGQATKSTLTDRATAKAGPRGSRAGRWTGNRA